MANRKALGNSVVTILNTTFDPLRPRGLLEHLNKIGRQAYAALERWGLIEEADAENGENGFVVLTGKGRSTTERADFERIRIRGLLKEEMLHPLLRGKAFSDFTDDQLGSAVFEAFLTVEIEVRKAAGRPTSEYGKSLLFKAFAPNGRWMSGKSKTECEALAALFSGAFALFRNPNAHDRRTSSDVLEAMEELMSASRLLRIIDELRSVV